MNAIGANTETPILMPDRPELNCADASCADRNTSSGPSGVLQIRFHTDTRVRAGRVQISSVHSTLAPESSL